MGEKERPEHTITSLHGSASANLRWESVCMSSADQHDHVKNIGVIQHTSFQKGHLDAHVKNVTPMVFQ